MKKDSKDTEARYVNPVTPISIDIVDVDSYNIRGDYLLVVHDNDSIAGTIENFISIYGNIKGNVYVAICTGDDKYTLYPIRELCVNGRSPHRIASRLTLEECKNQVLNRVNLYKELKPSSIIKNFESKLKELKDDGKEYALVCYDCFNVVRETDYFSYINNKCCYCLRKLSKRYFKKKVD